MTVKLLNANIREQPGVAIIDLAGEINSFGEEALNSAYSQTEAMPVETILLNFVDVDYINSTGIALIVGLLARARKSKRRLVVSGLTEHYVEIFQITRLADFMTIFPSEEAALAEIA